MDPLTDIDAVEESTDSLTVNPNETRQPLVIGVTTAALAVSTIVTALRIYVRALKLRKWGWDDSVLVASYTRAMEMDRI
ncbi:hypothetical protein CCHL11_07043 [Colletotrichum chlorophyti]|uniref:Uncharacterized protein n=1 Tax=Colletotrichum chlorophyti TaxID=708187 RepID=A0A1Q8RCI3_9PEZI|nr:hypothetical protein CCHL11_07043 [Colletotrichum chlorophyti]